MDPRREKEKHTGHPRSDAVATGWPFFPGPAYDVRPRPNTDKEPTAAVRDDIRASSSTHSTIKMKIK